MREIEVKARVSSIDDIIRQLEAAGVTVGPAVTQRDEVFGPQGDDGMSANDSPWLRIRTETKDGVVRYIFTLKKSISDQLDSIEHETEVADPDELRQIILHSGFTPYSDLTKTRRKAVVDGIELCIDAVDGLGTFVEAEKLTDEDVDAEQVRDELWNVLERYGAMKTDEITQGYDTLAKSLETRA